MQQIHILPPFLYRKDWVKRQRIVHSYGDEELIDPAELQEQLEECMQAGTVPNEVPTLPTGTLQPTDVDVIIGGKKCKCGSTTHQRTSHKDCPLGTKGTKKL